MAPKLPLTLASEVNMWDDMPNMAVEALGAFPGFSWSAVRMLPTLKWPTVQGAPWAPGPPLPWDLSLIPI